MIWKPCEFHITLAPCVPCRLLPCDRSPEILPELRLNVKSRPLADRRRFTQEIGLLNLSRGYCRYFHLVRFSVPVFFPNVAIPCGSAFRMRSSSRKDPLRFSVHRPAVRSRVSGISPVLCLPLKFSVDCFSGGAYLQSGRGGPGWSKPWSQRKLAPVLIRSKRSKHFFI
jgi:hypothetical protein